MRSGKPAAATHTKHSVEIAADRKTKTTRIVIELKGALHGAFVQPKHQERLRLQVEQLVGGVMASSSPVASVHKLSVKLRERPEPTRTKAPNGTIGVTSTEYLHSEICDLADEKGIKFAPAARELFDRGFSAFQERLWNESSESVLSDFKGMAEEYQSDRTRQWPLRIERRKYQKAILLAKEYGLSASELAGLCIAAALLSTVEA